jgi:CBS-domain-containing membrane protein
MSVSVGAVMSDRVVAVRQNARVSEIVAAMRRFHVTSLPVIDAESRVTGLVSADDLLRRNAGGRGRGLLRWFRARTGGSGTEWARDAARAMYRHRIRQLPVVDPVSGRLTGIVTRCDLLAVYERPDADIRREILNDIIGGTLRMDPERFTVNVLNGAVTIRGEVDRHSLATRLAEAIGHVEGVVGVSDQLLYRWDDLAHRTRRAHL